MMSANSASSGVHLTLFAFLIRLYVDSSLYIPRGIPPLRSSWRPIAYASLLFLFATVGFCLQTWLDHDAFVLNRTYPGGPLAYIAARASHPRNYAITAVYVEFISAPLPMLTLV